MSKAKTDPKVQAVMDAWTKVGVNPAWHFSKQMQLKYDWPVLFRALEALTETQLEEKQ